MGIVGVLMCCGEEASKQAGIISLCRSLALLHCSTFHQMPPDATLLWEREATHNAMTYMQCIEATSFLVLLRKDKSDNLNPCRRIVGGC